MGLSPYVKIKVILLLLLFTVLIYSFQIMYVSAKVHCIHLINVNKSLKQYFRDTDSNLVKRKGICKIYYNILIFFA